MKKIIGICSILLIILMLLGLSSCGEEFDIEENNARFFKKYHEHVEDGISLDELGLYYYESYFYYDVIGHDVEKDYHFLYLYRYQHFHSWYSIKHPEKDWDYYPGTYFDFLEAKEKGESKLYSDEELSALKNLYYNESVQ